MHGRRKIPRDVCSWRLCGRDRGGYTSSSICSRDVLSIARCSTPSATASTRRIGKCSLITCGTVRVSNLMALRAYLGIPSHGRRSLPNWRRQALCRDHAQRCRLIYRSQRDITYSTIAVTSPTSGLSSTVRHMFSTLRFSLSHPTGLRYARGIVVPHMLGSHDSTTALHTVTWTRK